MGAIPGALPQALIFCAYGARWLRGVSNTLGVAMAIYVYVRAARVTTFVPVLSLILLTFGVGEPVVAVISPFGGLRGPPSFTF